MVTFSIPCLSNCAVGIARNIVSEKVVSETAVRVARGRRARKDGTKTERRRDGEGDHT